MNKLVIQDHHIYLDKTEIVGVTKFNVEQEVGKKRKVTLTFYADVSLDGQK
ncbi:hypothetical protein [Pediococcus pentosaceus]|uniref:hypothetical protein n=1 Tax=Pediococcus pentosaceus TaxID=1255 RepID=UPI001F56ADA3|nr:hypothetical protein [Pediococcus pentosaceus]MCI2961051.1 hypothetical protein [Pediococcus pentosaceus]